MRRLIGPRGERGALIQRIQQVWTLPNTPLYVCMYVEIVEIDSCVRVVCVCDGVENVEVVEMLGLWLLFAVCGHTGGLLFSIRRPRLVKLFLGCERVDF
jgi:hypothetical protein